MAGRPTLRAFGPRTYATWDHERHEPVFTPRVQVDIRVEEGFAKKLHDVLPGWVRNEVAVPCHWHSGEFTPEGDLPFGCQCREELFCEVFAALLLMPWSAVQSYWRTYPKAELATIFEVEPWVVEFRIAIAKLWHEDGELAVKQLTLPGLEG